MIIIIIYIYILYSKEAAPQSTGEKLAAFVNIFFGMVLKKSEATPSVRFYHCSGSKVDIHRIMEMNISE